MRHLASLALVGLVSSTLAAADADPDLPKKAIAIFETSCIKCHGPEKQRGELRLDSAEALAKGGENGPVVVPGKPEESKLITGVKREGDEDYHMPPKAKDALPPDQVKILVDWVAAGAKWPE